MSPNSENVPAPVSNPPPTRGGYFVITLPGCRDKTIGWTSVVLFRAIGQGMIFHTASNILQANLHITRGAAMHQIACHRATRPIIFAPMTGVPCASARPHGLDSCCGLSS